MKIGFLSTDGLKTYMDKPPYKHGDTRDVTKELGEHLCKTFPINFFPAGEMNAKLKADKKAAQDQETDDAMAAPAGHPEAQIGDMGGVDTSGLTDDEASAYESAVAKIDKNEELTKNEQTVFDKVESHGG